MTDINAMKSPVLVFSCAALAFFLLPLQAQRLPPGGRAYSEPTTEPSRSAVMEERSQPRHEPSKVVVGDGDAIGTAVPESGDGMIEGQIEPSVVEHVDTPPTRRQVLKKKHFPKETVSVLSRPGKTKAVSLKKSKISKKKVSKKSTHKAALKSKSKKAKTAAGK